MGLWGSRNLPPPPPPTNIIGVITAPSGKYSLHRKLGEGAFGVVYLCSRNGEFYAIKMVKLSANHPLESALTELEALKQLKHPNIVKLFDFFPNKTTNELCVVMEYCENGDVASFLSRARLADTDKEKHESAYLYKQAVQWTIEMLRALKEVHAKGIIHRDLKPANFFVTKDFKIKLGDFGVSRLNTDGKTDNYTIAGSIPFMAPEVLRKQAYSSKADIWSLGITFLQVVLQQVSDESTRSIAGLNVTGQIRAILPLIQQPTANHLLSRMLQEDYHQRPSAEELLDDPVLNQWSLMTRMETQGKISLPTSQSLNANPKIILPFLDWIMDDDENQIQLGLNVLNELQSKENLSTRCKQIIALEIWRPQILKKLLALPKSIQLVLSLLKFCLLQTLDNATLLQHVQTIFFTSKLIPIIILYIVLADRQDESLPMTIARYCFLRNSFFQTEFLECSFAALLEKFSSHDPAQALVVLSDLESLSDLSDLPNLKANFIDYFRAAEVTSPSVVALCFDLIHGRESQPQLILESGAISFLSNLLNYHQSGLEIRKQNTFKALNSLINLIVDVPQAIIRDSFIGVCSVQSTGLTYFPQVFVHCETCYPDQEELGVCSSCAWKCHGGHNLKFKFTPTCFCDCNLGQHPLCHCSTTSNASTCPIIGHSAPEAQFSPVSLSGQISCKETDKSQLKFSCTTSKAVSVFGKSFSFEKNGDDPSPISYFEVRWRNVGNIIGIGYSLTSQNPINFLVGYSDPEDSIGWHGDDGNVFRRKKRVCSTLPFKYDTVGCGLTKSGSFFLTANGILLGIPVKHLPGGTYTPCVSFTGGSEFEIVPKNAWAASWLRSDGFHEVNGTPCWRPGCKELINSMVSSQVSQRVAAIIGSALGILDDHSKKVIDPAIRLLLVLCRLDTQFVSILRDVPKFVESLITIPVNATFALPTRLASRDLAMLLSSGAQPGLSNVLSQSVSNLGVISPTILDTTSTLLTTLGGSLSSSVLQPVPLCSTSSTSSSPIPMLSTQMPSPVMGSPLPRCPPPMVSVQQKGAPRKRLMGIPLSCNSCDQLQTIIATQYKKSSDDISDLCVVYQGQEFDLNDDILSVISNDPSSVSIVVTFKDSV